MYQDRIYSATPDDLIDCIHSFDDHRDLAIMIGHNSGFTTLANILGNLHIDNVPTCGIVALKFEVDTWKNVKKKEGIFDFFYYPKMLGK